MELYTKIINSFVGGWEVLSLFLIPIGGGIPAGVVLASKKGIAWPAMMVLYFISDVILACVFEPVMLLVIKLFKDKEFFKRMHQAIQQNTQKLTAHYGTNLGPLALIMISFGVDPMTGRSVTKAVGHGFFTGWLLAIAGDMMYFSVIMVSTLWLSDVLGDGTTATIIILALMIGLPVLVRKIRERRLLSKK
jgi:uncharacterized membrane protein